MMWVTKEHKNSEIKKRDGYLIVVGGWLFMTLFGSLPYLISGSIPNLTNAFFETMSGFTTTGSTILDDIESLPKSILFWRSMTQWIGGMGIIVLTIAILPLLGIGGMELFIAEAPGPTKDKIHPRIKETAKRLWIIYFGLTMLETIILMVIGLDFFDAVNHSLTTTSTGGFSTKQASIAAFQNPWLEAVIVIFMLLAGTNFTLIYFGLKMRFNKILKNNFPKNFSLKGTKIVIDCANGAGYKSAPKILAELGAKILLPSGYLNIAVFDQKIEGFQSNTFIGTGFVLANAGSQSTEGFEFDLVMSPTENLDIAISGLFMDPIYDSFPASSAGDLTGTMPSNISEDTISSTVTWNWNSNNWDGYFRLSHLYASEAKLLENPGWQAILEAAGNGIKTQDTLNFSAGLEKDDLSIMFWAKNINDDKYLISAFPAVADPTESTFFGYPNAYRSYGLTVNYMF